MPHLLLRLMLSRAVLWDPRQACAQNLWPFEPQVMKLFSAVLAGICICTGRCLKPSPTLEHVKRNVFNFVLSFYSSPADNQATLLAMATSRPRSMTEATIYIQNERAKLNRVHVGIISTACLPINQQLFYRAYVRNSVRHLRHCA